jgi:hypothetical protein
MWSLQDTGILMLLVARKVISQYELYHKSQQGKAVGLKA